MELQGFSNLFDPRSLRGRSGHKRSTSAGHLQFANCMHGVNFVCHYRMSWNGVISQNRAISSGQFLVAITGRLAGRDSRRSFLLKGTSNVISALGSGHEVIRPEAAAARITCCYGSEVRSETAPRCRKKAHAHPPWLGSRPVMGEGEPSLGLRHCLARIARPSAMPRSLHMVTLRWRK